MAQQYARDEAGHIWEVDEQGNPLRLVQAAPSAPASQGQVFTLPQDPLEVARDQAALARTNQEISRSAATAPYDARRAAADAAKAEADAEKAKRDLAAQQATATPQQQRQMAALANDEVLAAINRARQGINAGWSAGYVARLPEMLQPQSALDLKGDLSTVASRITLDTLAKLKQTSPTGASGLGSLTEREGELLRDSIASLGQTQSPQKLLESLANVERHYRNVQALMAGEDYRDPRVAERYGIAGLPDTGPDGRSLTQGPMRQEPDPALRGVNNRVRSMVGAGRSADEINAYLESVRPGLSARVPGVAEAVRFRAQNPNVPLSQYPIQVEMRDVPMSSTRQFINSVAQTPLGAAMISGADAVSGGTIDNLMDNPALARAGMEQISRDNPYSSLAGSLVGGALAAAGAETAVGGLGARWAPRIGDALYGAVYGAGSTDEGNRAQGALKGAAEGALGGMIGRNLTRAAGAGLRGVTNPDVQYLRSQGVPMTVGQMGRGSGWFGDYLARREDRLAGYAGIGDAINGQRRGGLTEFNRAAFRQGLEPIGSQAVDNVAEQGIEGARQAVGNAYDQALSGVQLTADPEFVGDVGAALSRGRQIPRTGPEFEHVVNSRVAPAFNAGNGTITGRQFQDVLQGIRGADFGTDAMGVDASNALGDVEGALTGLVQRQAPEALPRLDAANRAYRNTSILADAVNRGLNTDGIFTPAQLGQAARANAQRFNGRIASATTDRPFFDLQRAAQNVLPSKVPDSGTAGRIQAGRGIGGAISGTIRNVLNAPLYSDSVQPVLNALALDRPELLMQIGEQVGRRARVGGLFGAPMLLQNQTVGVGGY